MSGSRKSFRIVWVVGVAALCLPFFACEEEGAAERAGRAIDEAAESAREGLEDLTRDEGPLERAGRKADESLEKAKEAFSD
jgi:hypothetical protein